MSIDVREQLTKALSTRYAVDRLIGTGGMATVYLARDLRHDRLVALKVLNPELGAVLGSDRFLAEIKVTANLQHPNLLPLFDSGDADGLLFYVMPYVEGESLRARLDRERQLPVDEAVRLATAVSSALDYAHRRGVIHRDLKPGNILLHEGQPLVADFGIALAVSNAGGARITQTGLSLGTPQYMSPEQATGDRVIDARTDIYSLGAVLYEMLAGDPPHLGSTAQAIIAKVLTEKPPHVRIARDTVPESVDRAIEKALAKLPADRFATASKFADALQDKGDLMWASTPDATLQRTGRMRDAALRSGGLWIALLLSIALGAWGTLRPRDEQNSPVRFLVELPPQQDQHINGVALSPDASLLAYAGDLAIMARFMGDLDAQALAGTIGAIHPFFSPDGRWIGFQAEGRLKKVPVRGGRAVILVDSMKNQTAGTWTDDDRIIFTGEDHGLVIVPAGGGAPRPLTKAAPGEDHQLPQVLPNGQGVIFNILHGTMQTAEVAAATLDGTVVRLGLRGVRPQYLDGHLIFAHDDGSLVKVSFDAKQLTAGSEEVPLGQVVQVFSPGAANYAVSQSGSLIYVPGALPNQPVVVDRAGTLRPLPLDPRTYARPRFSPDGGRLLLDTRAGSFGEIWLYDIGTSTPQRLFSGEDAHQPEWRPDGKALAFTARNHSTGEDLYTMPLDGSARPQVVLATDKDQYDATWAPDGRSMVYLDDSPFHVISVLSLNDRNTSKLFDPGANGGTVLGPSVSPDGRWIAYWSNQSGRPQVYVRPFANAGAVVQVSSQGGTEPVWAPNGHELFYRDGEKLMVADLAISPELAVTGRKLLFAQPFVADGGHTFYDVSPDAKSFVFLKNTEQRAKLVVVLNWTEELKRKFAKQ